MSSGPALAEPAEASVQALCEGLEQMLQLARNGEWEAVGGWVEPYQRLGAALEKAMAAGPTPACRPWLARATELHDELLRLTCPERDRLGRELGQGRRQHALGRAYGV